MLSLKNKELDTLVSSALSLPFITFINSNITTLGPSILSGISAHHDHLCEALQSIYGLPKGFIVANASVANLTAIPLLAGPDDIIFSDEFNHATIVDGCDLSRATVQRYKHLDMKQLEEQVLKRLNVLLCYLFRLPIRWVKRARTLALSEGER